MSEKKCSESFEEIFDSGGSGCRRTCCCGRVHFDGCEENGWDWGEGELEGLRENAKKEPDNYIEHDGAVGTMCIDDKEIVWGCECDTAWTYEHFILRHARQIAQYLNKRADSLKELSDGIRVKVPVNSEKVP